MFLLKRPVQLLVNISVALVGSPLGAVRLPDMGAK